MFQLEGSEVLEGFDAGHDGVGDGWFGWRYCPWGPGFGGEWFFALAFYFFVAEEELLITGEERL